MASQILKGILYLLFLLSLCERLVCGTDLSQKTTVDECHCCKLLKTVINKQTDMDKKISEISQQNRNLEKKIDLLVGSSDNCSEGRNVSEYRQGKIIAMVLKIGRLLCWSILWLKFVKPLLCSGAQTNSDLR